MPIHIFHGMLRLRSSRQMLRQAIITSKTANAIAVANTAMIVANERTYITPYANVRNMLFAWTEKAPAIDGRGKLSRAGSEAIRPFPLCTNRGETVGPNTSLSLCPRHETCLSASKICSLKPAPTGPGTKTFDLDQNFERGARNRRLTRWGWLTPRWRLCPVQSSAQVCPD